MKFKPDLQPDLQPLRLSCVSLFETKRIKMIIIALLLSQLERLEQPNENEGNAILSTGTWG